MSGTTVGTSLNYGYAGGISRVGPNQPAIINRIVKSTSANVYFGQPVSLTTDGYVIDPTTTVISATNFAGVAIINVQTYLTYPTTQNSTQRGYYPANAPCDIIQQGIVSVYIQRGTSINQSGTVYVRTATNGSYPTAVVGGFETSADGSNTVALTNAVWNTNKIDANGIAELFILYPIAG